MPLAQTFRVLPNPMLFHAASFEKFPPIWEALWNKRWACMEPYFSKNKLHLWLKIIGRDIYFILISTQLSVVRWRETSRLLSKGIVELCFKPSRDGTAHLGILFNVHWPVFLLFDMHSIFIYDVKPKGNFPSWYFAGIWTSRRLNLGIILLRSLRC